MQTNQQTEHQNWILNPNAIEKLLAELKFRDAIIRYICDVSREYSHSPNANALIEFCNTFLGEKDGDVLTNAPCQWQVLAAVSAIPQAIEKHRARGVPFEVTISTFGDMQRRMEDYYARNGQWGFNKLGWLRNHLRGEFFEIGRLQYIPGKFGYKFRIYQHSESGEIIPFALPGLKCTPQGWPCDDATAFETILEETDDGIAGHPALANGAISSAIQKIPAASKVLIDADSEVVLMHIPSGDKLSKVACCQSLQDANNFFEKYFPETQFHAFCTATWLLDPELGKVLPADSNIASFGHRFHPLALTNANDRQLRERVFTSAEWDQCKAQSSLQKAVLNHHNNGGAFRTTAGFILPEGIRTFALQMANTFPS